MISNITPLLYARSVRDSYFTSMIFFYNITPKQLSGFLKFDLYPFEISK